MKQKWYLQTWFICLLFALWWLMGIPLIIGIILLVVNRKQSKKIQEEYIRYKNLFEEIGAVRYEEVTSKMKEMDSKQIVATQKLNEAEALIKDKEAILTQLNLEIEKLSLERDKFEKQIVTQTNKIGKIKELYKSVDYAVNEFLDYVPNERNLKLPQNDLNELEAVSPSVILKLNCMDIKELKKAYNENNKVIDMVLSQYDKRYTTKANKTIYQLMVLALRAELQNILYNLKYDKLEQSIDAVKSFTQKYLKIAADGNQSIAGTLTKFIGEVEYLFINAIKIEYNYYVKKEKAKQEQLALRQQMREEAEERRLLALKQKQIEKEEEKYNNEITKIQEQLLATNDDDRINEFKARILELQSQLSEVNVKKDEIIKLQNGKAGNVYIISNLGSFGENVFKVGMTRRLNPQDRIDELGSASVPFRFDVHSFIFSDDAVGLEKKLHSILHEKRVNKVNFRKEFFNTTIQELEELVTEIEPTAEFNTTMLAEEFRQSLSSDVLYENNSDDYYNDMEDDEELSQED